MEKYTRADWTENTWAVALARGRTVVDVGQLSRDDRRALDQMVRAGLAIKYREPWLGHLGPPRAHWFAAPQPLGPTPLALVILRLRRRRRRT